MCALCFKFYRIFIIVIQHIHLNVSVTQPRPLLEKITWPSHTLWLVEASLISFPAVEASPCRGPSLARCVSRQLRSFCPDWLLRPGAEAAFAFLPGKSPRSSNKAWYKVQRMLVSSWCGAASSCGCNNSEQRGGNHHFDLVLSMFWAVCVVFCENTESRTAWALSV